MKSSGEKEVPSDRCPPQSGPCPVLPGVGGRGAHSMKSSGEKEVPSPSLPISMYLLIDIAPLMYLPFCNIKCMC